MIKFIKMDDQGKPLSAREIDQADVMKCPHAILMEDHYRADGTCRCNDSTHFEMAEWGYYWDGKLWQSPPEDGDAA